MTCDHMAELTELRRKLAEQSRKLEIDEPYVFGCGHAKPFEWTWCRDCVEDLRRRLCDALAERDRWRSIAEQRIDLRRELERALGVEHLHGDDQIRIALETVEAYRVNAGADAEKIAELEEALLDLVAVNEEWNRAAEKVVGRPPGWSDAYLDRARRLLGMEVEP